MQAFLELVVKGLIQHPDQLTITPVERNGMTVYELRLNPEDVGREHYEVAGAVREHLARYKELLDLI